jgi:arylsulfatase A-like enzyme
MKPSATFARKGFPLPGSGMNPIRTLLAALLLAPSALPGAVDASKPNLVFVLFDDLGYGEPTCYRAESRLKTPNLDRLAREGMRFTDAHSAASVCTPTRYGVLTGRYPSRIGQYGVLTTYSAPIIPPTRLTVASLLRQHGYRTACIGKWHLGMRWDGKPGSEQSIPVGARLQQSPNAVGFDLFYGFTHARNIGTIIEQDRVVENVAETENQPRMIAKAVQWIGQRKPDEPFFLYFPMCPPHTPIAPAPEFVGRSGATDEVKHDPNYGDWVFQGDAMLGRILDALEEQGVAENTLVIATADNGAAGRAYPPLRASKSSIYEGGHRVPFLARWPGKIRAGSVCDATVCLNDLMATCAEILGVPLPGNAGEDSVSLLPHLLGNAPGPMRQGVLHQSSGGDLALRQGPWKLIVSRSGRRELYDLHADLGETKDVAAANPEVVERLAAVLEEIIARGRSTPGEPQQNDAPFSLARPSAGERRKGRNIR